jgi:hypothetical protein
MNEIFLCLDCRFWFCDCRVLLVAYGLVFVVAGPLPGFVFGFFNITLAGGASMTGFLLHLTWAT